jgi:hypothetical protein
MRYDAVYSSRNWPSFRRKALSSRTGSKSPQSNQEQASTSACGLFPLFTLQVCDMEAVCLSETLVNFYRTTGHNIPKDNILNIHRCENLKSNITEIVPFIYITALCQLMWLNAFAGTLRIRTYDIWNPFKTFAWRLKGNHEQRRWRHYNSVHSHKHTDFTTLDFRVLK